MHTENQKFKHPKQIHQTTQAINSLFGLGQRIPVESIL